MMNDDDGDDFVVAITADDDFVVITADDAKQDAATAATTNTNFSVATATTSNVPATSTNATTVVVADTNSSSSSMGGGARDDDDDDDVISTFNDSRSVVGRHNITIVVSLGGEMGNHLSKVAYAYTMKLELKRRYNIESYLILKHQSATKWERAQNDCKECFPFFRSYNFSAAFTEEYIQQKDQQEKFFKEVLKQSGTTNSTSLSNNPRLRDPTDEELEYLNKLLLQSEKDNVYNFTTMNTNMKNDGDLFTFPMINSVGMIDVLGIDKYYHEIRNLFKFDYSNPNCCKQLPDPDEPIFHFRNFYTELFDGGAKAGFSELNPINTANKLFGHLKPGSTIAIATRFIPYRDNTRIFEYVDAFSQRGVNVRLTSDENITHTGVQDFCFLLSGQSEVGGSAKSTYYKWSVLLSNYTQERINWLYYLDNVYTPREGENRPELNWTYHPELESTIRVKIFDDEGVNNTEWEKIYGQKHIHFSHSHTNRP